MHNHMLFPLFNVTALENLHRKLSIRDLLQDMAAVDPI